MTPPTGRKVEVEVKGMRLVASELGLNLNLDLVFVGRLRLRFRLSKFRRVFAQPYLDLSLPRDVSAAAGKAESGKLAPVLGSC